MTSKSFFGYAAIAATVLATGLALAGADQGAAADAYYQQRGPVPFEAFDRDGNGQLSREEFHELRAARLAYRAEQGRALRHAAQAPGFEAIDSNGDGVISREEHAAHQQQRWQERMQQRMAPGPRCGGAAPGR